MVDYCGTGNREIKRLNAISSTKKWRELRFASGRAGKAVVKLRAMAHEHPISCALGTLSDILNREKARGRTHVPIKTASWKLLSEMPIRFLALSQSAKFPRSGGSGAFVTAPAPAPAVVSAMPPRSERNEEWARKELIVLCRELRSSEVFSSLETLRNQVVYPVGNPVADIMFLGEAPGVEEESEKRPFVGPAGQKLSQIIKAMGLNREEVYLSNLVKFRPKKGDGRFQGASNRKPDATEMEAGMQFVRREVEIVNPKIIVALGVTVAEGLLEKGGTISGLREQSHEFAGVPVVVTYHPGHLVRTGGDGDEGKSMALKRKIWEDMLKVMDHLGMPVSGKQRDYFLP